MPEQRARSTMGLQSPESRVHEQEPGRRSPRLRPFPREWKVGIEVRVGHRRGRLPCGGLETQNARALGLQQRMDDANAVLDRVEQALADAPTVASVRYQLERGRVLNSSGDPDRARPLFEAAFAQAQEGHVSYLAVDAAHMVAITHGKDPDAAVEWNERAIGIVESSDDALTQKWKGSLYNNLGWAYHDKNGFERALRLFQKALDYRRARQRGRGKVPVQGSLRGALEERLAGEERGGAHRAAGAARRGSLMGAI